MFIVNDPAFVRVRTELVPNEPAYLLGTSGMKTSWKYVSMRFRAAAPSRGVTSAAYVSHLGRCGFVAVETVGLKSWWKAHSRKRRQYFIQRSTSSSSHSSSSSFP